MVMGQPTARSTMLPPIVSSLKASPAVGVTPYTTGVELCAYASVQSESNPQTAPSTARSRMASNPGVVACQNPDGSNVPLIAGARQVICVPSLSRDTIGQSHIPPSVTFKFMSSSNRCPMMETSAPPITETGNAVMPLPVVIFVIAGRQVKLSSPSAYPYSGTLRVRLPEPVLTSIGHRMRVVLERTTGQRTPPSPSTTS